jgi:hypothetical protein
LIDKCSQCGCSSDYTCNTTTGSCFVVTCDSTCKLQGFASGSCKAGAAQSLKIKRYTVDEYGIFDTTPQIYAGLYDMSQASWGANTQTYMAAVHQIRPDFKALLYRNMRSILQTNSEWQTFVNNGWLLKDSLGNYIPCDVGYLVDVGNPGYQNWIANFVSSEITRLGYDGVFADCSLARGVGEWFYGVSTTLINPRTNKAWTDEEVRQAEIGLHSAIKSAIGSKLLLTNGIYSGNRFWWFQSQYTEVLSGSHMDGFLSEGTWFLRGDDNPPSYTPIWIPETYWLDSLNFLIWIQDNFLIGHPNRLYVPCALLRNTAGTPFPLPPGATPEQIATFAYMSTLLGAKTNQNYLALFGDSNFMAQVVQPLYNVDVGTPLNDYYMISGTHVYARDFSNVKVLVNPSTSSYTVSLGGSYKKLNGTIVSSITMNAHTGEILLKTTTTTTTSTSCQSGESSIGQDSCSSNNLCCCKSDLVANYKFDEGSGTTANDSSSFKNNATLYNSPVWTTGKSGSALSFNGANQYVAANNVPVNTSVGASNTVAFWMYWTGTKNQIPFSWNPTTNAYDLWLSDTDAFGFNTYGNDVYGISGATSLLANKWVHVAAIFTNGYPASEPSLYINGVKQTLSLLRGSRNTESVTSTLFIGENGPGSNYRFGGTIDEVKIWNRALSAAEIQAEYGF